MLPGEEVLVSLWKKGHSLQPQAFYGIVGAAGRCRVLAGVRTVQSREVLYERQQGSTDTYLSSRSSEGRSVKRECERETAEARHGSPPWPDLIGNVMVGLMEGNQGERQRGTGRAGHTTMVRDSETAES